MDEEDEGVLDSEDGVLASDDGILMSEDVALEEDCAIDVEGGFSTDGELDVELDLAPHALLDCEVEKSTDDELSSDLLQLMVPVSSEG